MRQYRRNHLSRRREEWKKWDGANPGWRSLLRTLRKRGITLDEYHAKFEAQDFGCAICGAEGTDYVPRLVVDHDHGTGKFRGLLCHTCNRAIGLFGDSSERLVAAQKYLDAAA